MSHLRGSQAKFLLIASAFLFGALIASVVPSSPALACTLTATPLGFSGFTFADHVNSAHIIIDGTIISVAYAQDAEAQDGYRRWDDIATIQAHQYLKGDGPELITIRGFGPSTACKIEAAVDDHRIFYATIDTEGVLWVSIVASPNGNIIAQILDVVAQAPTTLSPEITLSPASTQAAPTSNPTSESNSLISYILGILGITSLVILAYFARRPKRL
jgi:hypothetical protein